MVKKATSKAYYYVLSKMTKVPIQKDTGDFRLLDKRCVQAICYMRENNRCSKSLFSWIGFNKKEILFEREKRIAGNTKWNYFNLIKLAVDGITSLSTYPLKLITYISSLFILILILYGAVIGCFAIGGNNISDISIIIFIILLFSTIQMSFISIVGIYLSRMFVETKNRPLYLLDEINGKKEKNQFGEKNEKQKAIIWILIIITILQISVRIYVGGQKTYFHIDEAYSYGLMNYDKLNITDNEDFLNIWHDKSYYLDYLEINDDEKLDWKPVYENQKNDGASTIILFFTEMYG